MQNMLGKEFPVIQHLQIIQKLVLGPSAMRAIGYDDSWLSCGSSYLMNSWGTGLGKGDLHGQDIQTFKDLNVEVYDCIPWGMPVKRL
jgi:hypothetical protein